MTYLDLADLNTFLFLSRHIKIFTVPKNNFYYFKKIVIEFLLVHDTNENAVVTLSVDIEEEYFASIKKNSIINQDNELDLY